jgi:hypothetical protein
MATSDRSLPLPQRVGALGNFIAAGLTPYTLSFVLLLIATFIVFRNVQAAGVAFKPDAIANVGNVLAPLVLIAAFIERAVEVVLTPVRGDHADRLRSRIDKEREAGGDVAALERQLHEYKLANRRIAFFLAVMLGLIAALLGFRGLEALFATPPGAGSSLQFFDIVLTGVVIAGGADGIHTPVQAFTDYMERISKNAKAPPAPVE